MWNLSSTIFDAAFGRCSNVEWMYGLHMSIATASTFAISDGDSFGQNAVSSIPT